jgi:outer membrane receptor protein involved in Fe transport
MTGSRVAMDVRELPFEVNIITSELFDDFAMFEIGDDLAYVSGLTGVDQGGTFNLRGFNASNQLRDGFMRLGRYGKSNIDRVEVIKGPNAAIYGQTSPGGMINMISKKPAHRKRINIWAGASFGSYNTNREDLSYSGPVGLIKNTYQTIAFGRYEREFDREGSWQRNQELYYAIDHVFGNGSTLLLQAEYFLSESKNNQESWAVPFVLDAAGRYIGLAPKIGLLQPCEPDSQLDRSIYSITGTYEGRLARWLSLRLSGNLYKAGREDWGVTGWDVLRPTVLPDGSDGYYTDRTPNGRIGRNKLPERGGGVQADLVASYNTGAIKHKTVLTYDYNIYHRHEDFYLLHDGNINGLTETGLPGSPKAAWLGINRVYFNADLTAAVGEIRHLGPGAKDQLEPYNPRRARSEMKGVLLRHQLSFLDGRGLFFAGIRHDTVDYASDGDYWAVNVNGKIRMSATSPNIGLNFRLIPSIRAFANYSRSFNSNQQDVPQYYFQGGAEFDKETSAGWDYGLRGSFFGDALNICVAGYYVTRANVMTQDINADGGTVYMAEGDHLVRGLDIDFTWKVSQNFFWGFAYGHVKSQITDLGYKYMSVGRSPRRVTPDSLSTYIKYNVSQGLFKGLSATLGFKYYGPTPLQNPDAGDAYSLVNGAWVYTGSTNAWSIHAPSFHVVDFGLSYTFRALKLQHTLRLNIKNVLDAEYVTSKINLGEKRGIYGGYSLKF